MKLKRFIIITQILSINMLSAENIFTQNTNILMGNYEYFCTSDTNIHFEEIKNKKDIKFKVISNKEKLTKPNQIQWLRFSIDNRTNNNIIFDAHYFYNIDLYIPSDSINCNYKIFSSNPSKPFLLRDITYIHHAFLLPVIRGKSVYYARIISSRETGLGFFLKSPTHFYRHSILSIIFPISFISILLIVLILNLILLIRLKETIYFYYILYLISSIWYELSTTGYLNALFSISYIGDPIFFIPFSLITLALLMYIKAFLFTSSKDILSDRLLKFAIGIKIGLLVIQIFTGYFPKNSADLDLILMFLPFFPIVRAILKGFKPARILLISYLLLLIGYFGHSYFNILLNYISPSQKDIILYLGQFFLFSNLLETLLFSYALSERFVVIKSEKELEQRKTIASQDLLLKQAAFHQELKDNMNKNLEIQVKERTLELAQVNEFLEIQAQEIEKMNQLLKTDNEKLTQDVEMLQKARLLDKNLSFEEFKETFPNETKCLQFIAQLKWADKYNCKKCKYNKYYLIEDQASRKCKNCSYLESATVATVLDNVKFSSQKALYLLYASYTVKNPNIKKISQEIDLRTATAYSFINKIADLVKKESMEKSNQGDWTELILGQKKN